MAQSSAALGRLAHAAAFLKGRSSPAVATWAIRGYSASSTDDSTSTASAQGAPSGPPKLVVLGGRGFVGSHVCAEAVNSGLQVLGVSRGGTPPLVRDPWVEAVSWVRGNALEPKTLEKHLQGADAVVSCIGAFGSQAEMLKLNGAANIAAIEAAKAAGVKRFVFISAHIPNVPGIETILGGYIRGKQAAEEALRTHFPTSGVALRPGAIYGNRVVSTNLTIPLGVAFKPIELLLQKMGPQAVRNASQIPVVGAAFVPPVNVETVARVAVRAATDPSVPAGVIDVWQLAAEGQGH